MKRKAGIFEIAKAIREESKKAPTKDYGSGLLGEHLIVSSYKIASSKDLIGMRYLINKILEERTIQARIKAKSKENDINITHSSSDDNIP